ncbi:MAG: flagellar hook-basal body protein [Candidatus Eremiobacteraeota bacterium]|nr:flagellar hook-basal body protein [Candidatus Eremiobacteraeota bacterium]MBC5826779.1 flagellar hook-basal body protein [Candidatus Eremiobacteraeota bacterium]
MNKALAAGAAGMALQQSVLDAIAVNLANSDTPGYRADRPEFAALLTPDGHGIGVARQDPRRLFTQGKIETTGKDDDLAIDGEGLFEVRSPSGTAYTRAGNFSRDALGRLRLPNGAMLADIRLPRGTTTFSVSAGGEVRAHVAGRAGTVSAGRVRLYSFSDNASLRLCPDGLFYPTASAGQRFGAFSSSSGFGTVKQRCLERGNVSVIAAMMAILTAQRAYEANAKSVQAADEMLRLANNVERG